MRYVTRIAAGLSAYAVALATMPFGPGDWIHTFYSTHFCFGNQFSCSGALWISVYGILTSLGLNWLLLRLLRQRQAFRMALMVSVMMAVGFVGLWVWLDHNSTVSNTLAYTVVGLLVVVAQSAATWAFKR